MGARTKRSNWKGLYAPGAAPSPASVLLRRSVWRRPPASTTAPVSSSVSPVRTFHRPSCRRRDCIHARVQAQIDAQPARQLYHRLEELAHRLGGNAQAAGLRRTQKGLVKYLARVLHRTIFKAVVQRAGDDGLPEVADGAAGLAGALEPCGEALRVALGIAAQEARQPRCDGGLVAQTKHRRAPEADGLMCGRGQTAESDPTAARRPCGGWLQKTKLVVPADRTTPRPPARSDR